LIKTADASEPFRKLQIANYKSLPTLLHLFMRGVLAALPAKLAELQPVRRRLPVLGRGVVLVLARRALQLNNFPWHSSSYCRIAESKIAELQFRNSAVRQFRNH
jgi:hypothetical protein